MVTIPTGSASFPLETIPSFIFPTHRPVGPVPPVWNLRSEQRIGPMGALREREVLVGMTGGLPLPTPCFTMHPSSFHHHRGHLDATFRRQTS